MKSVVAAAILAWLCVSAPPASAEEGDSGALLVIMDVSGSMGEADPAGGTRIEGARRAVNELVSSVPDGTRIGLRLYGDTFAGSDKTKGCADTRLAVPIGPVERTGARITQRITSAEPTGFTPIGHALEQAAGDFDDESNRSVILVSDGEDTCGTPAPCRVARTLKKSGIAVRVDTIGLTIAGNQKARSELKCIADATGGDFVEAADANQLTERLTALSSRAISGWAADGEQVEGGPIITQATPITPGTTYVDDVLGGEARWYSFSVEEGQKVIATVGEDGSVNYGCCLALELFGVDQTGRLARDSDIPSGAPQVFSVDTGDAGAYDTGTYYLSVDRSSASAGSAVKTPVAFQLDVSVEDDPATMPTETPEATPAEEPSATDSAAATPTAAPGDSPDAAQADAADDSGTSNGLLLTLVIVLGVIVLVMAGALTWLITQTRRRQG